MLNETQKQYLKQNLNFSGNPYTGAGDPSLQFGGGASNILQESAGLEFGFTVSNATSGSLAIAITPTYLGSAAAIATATGLTCDHILADGTIATNVTGTASDSNLTIANFKNWTLYNPTAITEIELQANNSAAWDENISIVRVDPFNGPGTKKLNLNRYLDQYQTNTLKITIPLLREFPSFQFDNQTAVIFTIGGTNKVATTGVSLQVRFRAGAILNTAGELANKRALAMANAARMVQLATTAGTR